MRDPNPYTPDGVVDVDPDQSDDYDSTKDSTDQGEDSTDQGEDSESE